MLPNFLGSPSCRPRVPPGEGGEGGQGGSGGEPSQGRTGIIVVFGSFAALAGTGERANGRALLQTPSQLGHRDPQGRFKGPEAKVVGPYRVSAKLSHSLNVSDHCGNTPKSSQNRSESLCAGLWVPRRVFGVGLASV